MPTPCYLNHSSQLLAGTPSPAVRQFFPVPWIFELNICPKHRLCSQRTRGLRQARAGAQACQVRVHRVDQDPAPDPTPLSPPLPSEPFPKPAEAGPTFLEVLANAVFVLVLDIWSLVHGVIEFINIYARMYIYKHT
jgi:hypothetical protein